MVASLVMFGVYEVGSSPVSATGVISLFRPGRCLWAHLGAWASFLGMVIVVVVVACT